MICILFMIRKREYKYSKKNVNVHLYALNTNCTFLTLLKMKNIKITF